MKKTIILLLFVVEVFFLQSCTDLDRQRAKKDKEDCEAGDIIYSAYNYYNSLGGKPIVFTNQYGDSLSMPSVFKLYSKYFNYYRTMDSPCRYNSTFKTEIQGDTLGYVIEQGDAMNEPDYWMMGLTYRISLGESSTYDKNYSFSINNTKYQDQYSGYPINISTYDKIYHKQYVINGSTFTNVYEVELKDTLNQKYFFKKYFINAEKGFLRFEERYSDKVWTLKNW